MIDNSIPFDSKLHQIDFFIKLYPKFSALSIIKCKIIKIYQTEKFFNQDNRFKKKIHYYYGNYLKNFSTKTAQELLQFLKQET